MILDGYTVDAPGIVQLDVLIRTALIKGIEYLRESELDQEWCFSFLANDALTSDHYGRKEIEAAKAWLRDTTIPVKMVLGLTDVEFPCFSVNIVKGEESSATLAEVNYEPTKKININAKTVAGPLTPVSIDTANYTATFADFGGAFVVEGMIIVTKTGQKYAISAVDGYTITLPAEAFKYSLTGLLIKTADPSFSVALGSQKMRETVQIGMHVGQGKAAHAMYLFSILYYILVRYKKDLFEARGFENYTISYGPLQQARYDDVKVVYERMFTLTGYVHNYWIRGKGGVITKALVQASAGDVATNMDPYESPFQGIPDENINSDSQGFGDGDPDKITWRF